MVNHKPSSAERTLKLYPDSSADWQVGETPAKWDVSFSERLWAAVRRWFVREPVRRMKITGQAKGVSLRRAA